MYYSPFQREKHNGSITKVDLCNQFRKKREKERVEWHAGNCAQADFVV
ncbi:hypothetical protein HMPREF1985_01324 [Mitsuokella sp. oral taxon 131 str. W9106]|nr:hypothetical protein HMPREF1985_01324 [Mitsuokella sp. oral taxon 131 str. W9106]